jgi:hypothetical protein
VNVDAPFYPISRTTIPMLPSLLTKSVLLEDIKTTLTYILCQDLEDEERLDMVSSIDDFLNTNANRYTAEELINRFDSAEKLLDLFIAFLECRRDMAGKTIH